ncbi:MAG TPA: aminomethyl-transferring glycine dehydrogenase [Verrucomicrobiae bacterium]|nr:aminomethyl-transferring glycine dehydrogenase [Verrucomicrobiae bacterium]
MTTLRHPDRFVNRHIGPDDSSIAEMLKHLELNNLEELTMRTVPEQIRTKRPLNLPAARGEMEALSELRKIASRNKVFRSFLGMGYYGCITPPVIQRNVLENPGWYTQYTPYQAEISQGRLESLVNFQTMVADLTALPVANASLLDEATAAAEAMHLCHVVKGSDEKNAFFVSNLCHPQTIAVVQTRAHPLGLEVVVGDHRQQNNWSKFFGVILQYPATTGEILDYTSTIEAVHRDGAVACVATDLLALTLLRPPGEFGADVAFGSAQRFGVPLGFGGPHAAFFATRDEHKRQMPGRLVGVSRDANGRPGYRLSLQTREQHIRREKATSNICTAQALLANMAAMYAVYHGPQGLRAIARYVHQLAWTLSQSLKQLGHSIESAVFFDTLTVRHKNAAEIVSRAEARQVNLRLVSEETVGISLDETSSVANVELLLEIIHAKPAGIDLDQLASQAPEAFSGPFQRTSEYLTHPVFNTHHSETEMLRYLHLLESKDLSLTTSMIPLGSCTMKLNATAEMYPVSWSEFSNMHPFAPRNQIDGYAKVFSDLEKWLAEITGFAATSLQPNAGSQGEYAGLLAILEYHASRGQQQRGICLIPTSAHGTNPASAVMAGFHVVPVACDSHGNIDVNDLRAKAAEHAVDLAVLMVTYPSTHGVFEESIQDICAIVHQYGGQVYMDGANLNAQVGLCRPAELGADVCHINLHKTFCIPHGGGGPGMGPICVAAHLAPFLPRHPLVNVPGEQKAGPVSAGPWGSASILPISWMYIAMMGPEGLRKATQVAILNANYVAKRLENYFPVLYKGKQGMVAHECIVDLRQFKSVTVEDVAKRLMDYGFHAPTISFPVAGTMMIEPTESESKEELDRFCDALVAIHGEIRAIELGRVDKQQNVIKNAPHTAEAVISDKWDRPYPREQAAFPAPWLRANKFWPDVGRIDNVYGDRNLFCTCAPVESYR